MKLPSKAEIQVAVDLALDEFVNDQVEVIKSAFIHGGHQHHGGEPWVARARPYPHPILYATGALQSSIVPSSSRALGYVESVSPYAVYHQFGTSNLPIRKVVDFTAQDRTRLHRQMKNRVEAVTNRKK